MSLKIYSIGAGDENHGPALPKNIDNFFAQHIALKVAEHYNADYVGHIPYSSDRVGDIAFDWNKSYIPMHELVQNIIGDIKRDKIRYAKAKLEYFSHVVIISGHGGNNFLLDEKKNLENELEVPVLYIPPLAGVYAEHPKEGRINPTHADDSEHSIAKYLGILLEDEFLALNELAKHDPIGVLKKWPELMGLAGYVLPEFGGVRYDALRKYCGPEMGRRFLERKSIIADADIGRQLIEGNIQMAKSEIEKFLVK